MVSDIRGVWLGQVTDVDPAKYQARVVFPNIAHLEGIKVALGGTRQHPVAGDFALPEPGDWGIIAFWTNDPRSGVWLTSVSDRFRHIIPTELWTDDPLALLRHTPGDHYTIDHGDGSTEAVWADGTMLRLTTTKDGVVGNPTASVARTPRKRTLTPALGREPERKPLAPAPHGPVDVVLEHSSGATIRITADGSFKLTTPVGHSFRLHDGTEKVRSATDDTTVLATPEEDANRIASTVILESEMGHRLTFYDDPILALSRYVRLEDPTGLTVELHDDPNPGANRRLELRHPAGHKVTLMQDPLILADVRVTVETGGGHKFEMRDMVAADKYARIQTAAGHILELRDTPTAKATVSTVGGRSVVMDDAGAVTTVTDPVKVIVNAPLVDLAGIGGPAVARVGDTVQVTVAGGSSAGVHAGTITGGSPKVTSQ